MPVIKYKGNKITLQWKPEWNQTCLAISDNQAYRKKNGQINWKKAEADDLLKGFARQLSLKDISRHTSVLRIKRNPRRYLLWKKRRALGMKKKYQSRESYKRKMGMFRAIPLKKRIKLGYKPKRIKIKWTQNQDKLLIILAKDKRFRLKSGRYTNWKKLLLDPLARMLPTNNRRDIENRYNRLRNIKSRRKKALEWKYKNLKRYHRNQARLVRTVKNVVNNFLYEKIETR